MPTTAIGRTKNIGATFWKMPAVAPSPISAKPRPRIFSFVDSVERISVHRRSYLCPVSIPLPVRQQTATIELRRDLLPNRTSDSNVF